MVRYGFRMALLVLAAACGPGPDLVGTDLEVPEGLGPGESVEGEPMWVVTNQGEAEASSASGSFHVDLALSLDNELPSGFLPMVSGYADDTLLVGGRDQVTGVLGPGESASDVLNIEIPANTPPGSYFLCASIDSSNEVAESNETNNVFCEPIEIEAEFCIDFEDGVFPATNGANASSIYGDLGVWFPTAPRIFRQPPLFSGFQGLFQGNPDEARLGDSCGPLEIAFDESLEIARVSFDARNVGFIDRPVAISAVAFDASGTEVDNRSLISRSRPGDLRPFERIELASHPGDATAEPPILEEPPVTRVVVEYRTCPPHVAIDNLCVEPKRSASCDASTCPETLVPDSRERWYLTTPAFSCVAGVHLVATFRNADPEGRSLDFTGASAQIWSVPSVIEPPVVVGSAPAGVIGHGDTFSYDLMIDVSGFPVGDDVLVFRPRSLTSGTMQPSSAPLVSATVECDEGF